VFNDLSYLTAGNPATPTPYLYYEKCNVNGTVMQRYYDYNENGAIKKITTDKWVGSSMTRLSVTDYEYDAVGRLTNEKVDKGGNVTNNNVTYLSNGNILTKNGAAYFYIDKDQLDTVTKSGGGVLYFAHDSAGYPLRYKTSTVNAPYNMTWTRARLLSSYGNVSYTYGADGVRVSKSNSGAVTTYHTLAGRLRGEDFQIA